MPCQREFKMRCLGQRRSKLASFWSTAPVIDGAHTLELCGFESGTRLIGMIYLGWPTGDTLPGMRPDLEINIIVVGQAYLINWRRRVR